MENKQKWSERLHPRLVKAIVNDVNGFDSWKIEGYTRLTTVSKKTGERVIYYATPYIMGSMWYDWSYVHFEEVNQNGNSVESFYPAKILGFVKCNDLTETQVIVQCTERPLVWSQVEKHFLIKVVLGSNDEVSTVSVPLTALVHPLCVIPDYGGDGKSYLLVLPRRNWSRYFGNKI